MSELGERAGGWDWWASLTFRERTEEQVKLGWTKVGWQYSGRAWDTFMTHLAFQNLPQRLWWVRGREYQHWRGVPHFHGLIGGVKDLRRLDNMDWWYGKYGIARIEPYDKGLGAGFYLCKYVTKELGDIQFSKGLTMK